MKNSFLTSLTIAALLPLSAFSQPTDFRRTFNLSLLIHRDTLSVLTGQMVTLTDPQWEWRSTPSCTLIVYNGGRVSRVNEQRCNVFTDVKAAKRYIIDSRVRFDTPDTFTVLRILEGQGPDYRVYRYGDEWQVHVRHPSLHPLLDSEYWYGEVTSFSFAAGHKGYEDYSFDVETGNRTLFSEKGSEVSINRIWQALSPDQLNMTITVKGKYKGKTFVYEDPVSKQARESIWSFELKSPNRIEDVSLWSVDTTFNNLKAANRWDLLPAIPLNINPNGKYNPREFRFSSYAVNRLSFLMFMPDARDVSITSTPAEFLSGYKWSADDPWRVLVIEPREDFLRDRTARNPAEVALTVRFRDQFGTSFNRVYKARVYLSQ